MSQDIKIIHAPSEENPFLLIYKRAGLPSAPLFEGEDSALTQAIKLFPEIAEVHGKKEIEHGLLHRIDTETNGLLLIASSQTSYEFLTRAQKEGKFHKWYRADVDFFDSENYPLEAFPALPEELKAFVSKKEINSSITVESSFRAFGPGKKEVRPVTKDSGRAASKKGGSVLYKTEMTFISEKQLLCHITAGYRHQVRCHLAWCKIPVHGDKVYNPSCRQSLSGGGASSSEKMAFTACKISFPHPLTQIPLVFQM
ncbi:MAG: hypothetical protein K5873_10475 [Treponema sp.]|nr:hypothetical protein [Treponema sp.]